MTDNLKLEFLMCGNHTDAFLSQAAIYRLMLDSLGKDYAEARLVLCVGGTERMPLPARWQKPFEGIEVLWADTDEYRLHGDLAQSDLIYRVMTPSANISIICDADTLLLQPFPEDFISAMVRSPALSGCIAHYPPPLNDLRTPAPTPVLSTRELWDILGRKILGRRIDFPFSYTLREEPEPCPFYINFGFFAGTPALFREFYREYKSLVPLVREVLDNDFYEQIALTFSIERAALPVRTLPIRFNFPNDVVAEALYPQDAADIINIHYLRTNLFNRHHIFAAEDEFNRFMGMPLEGSSAVFREALRNHTDGTYPFSCF
ncbi:MAG: hypothetical protein L0Z50_00955 [Verrucomicrobiales bacterium]|nr:hypothetical protein [Verrucomicrobiales bacterium]